MGRPPAIFVAGLIVAALVPNAGAEFLSPQTEQVPIGRLFANLEQRLARQTNDFLTTYHLARLHAMAYSTNLLQFSAHSGQPVFVHWDAGVPGAVQVPDTPARGDAARRHLTNAILLYERATILLRQSTNAAAFPWLILPLELGHAWCLDQARRREEALAAYRRTLSLAWKKEVEGEFDIKTWVQEKWQDLQAGRNPLRRSSSGRIGPGACYTEETIRYLLPLLDPVKDAKEIARLTEDRATVATVPRAVTPIVVPLGTNCSLPGLVDPDAAVSFDLDGTGLQRR